MTTITKAGREIRVIPKNTVSTPILPAKRATPPRKRAVGYWTAERFEEATAGGRNTRSKRAARRHLVDGLTQDAAAAEFGLTRGALTCALNRIRHGGSACPTCGHPLPHVT